jgi:hypothetical protein
MGGALPVKNLNITSGAFPWTESLDHQVLATKQRNIAYQL